MGTGLLSTAARVDRYIADNNYPLEDVVAALDLSPDDFPFAEQIPPTALKSEVEAMRASDKVLLLNSVDDDIWKAVVDRFPSWVRQQQQMLVLQPEDGVLPGDSTDDVEAMVEDDEGEFPDDVSSKAEEKEEKEDPRDSKTLREAIDVLLTWDTSLASKMEDATCSSTPSKVPGKRLAYDETSEKAAPRCLPLASRLTDWYDASHTVLSEDKMAKAGTSILSLGVKRATKLFAVGKQHQRFHQERAVPNRFEKVAHPYNKRETIVKDIRSHSVTMPAQHQKNDEAIIRAGLSISSQEFQLSSALATKLKRLGRDVQGIKDLVRDREFQRLPGRLQTDRLVSDLRAVWDTVDQSQTVASAIFAASDNAMGAWVNLDVNAQLLQRDKFLSRLNYPFNAAYKTDLRQERIDEDQLCPGLPDIVKGSDAEIKREADLRITEAFKSIKQGKKKSKPSTAKRGRRSDRKSDRYDRFDRRDDRYDDRFDDRNTRGGRGRGRAPFQRGGGRGRAGQSTARGTGPKKN